MSAYNGIFKEKKRVPVVESKRFEREK